MINYNSSKISVTGIGVVSAVGQGKADFTKALLEGRHAFSIMQRSGRQKDTAFIGAEISSLLSPAFISKRLLRTLSLSGQAALSALNEAWEDAKLHTVDPARIGLVIGGSNVQQRELLQTYLQYGERIDFVRPTYGISFMDSDLSGLCTELFPIEGFAYTVGGASASGQVSILQALHSVRSGQVDVCIALGALMDLSYLECQALRSLGAMGSDRYAQAPELACRPFDQNHDGFIYGENCGAIVIESMESAVKRGVQPYAELAGGAMKMDRNRNPDPSYAGEVHVIQSVLEQAGLTPENIDYINPHGTGSLIGDETEARAIVDCQLGHAFINTTKSIIGHGLSAAGTVEVIATLLQMKEKRLHPSLNLENPINDACRWVRGQSIAHDITHALTLSMGFGGINTALCFKKTS